MNFSKTVYFFEWMRNILIEERGSTSVSLLILCTCNIPWYLLRKRGNYGCHIQEEEKIWTVFGSIHPRPLLCGTVRSINTDQWKHSTSRQSQIKQVILLGLKYGILNSDQFKLSSLSIPILNCWVNILNSAMLLISIKMETGFPSPSTIHTPPLYPTIWAPIIRESTK